MSTLDPFGTVVLGRRMPAPVSGGRFVKGTVVDVVTSGGRVSVLFTDADFDGGKRKFGPAPVATWTVTVTDTDGDAAATVVGPRVGDKCLAVFVGAGTGDPWVIGWGAP